MDCTQPSFLVRRLEIQDHALFDRYRLPGPDQGKVIHIDADAVTHVVSSIMGNPTRSHRLDGLVKDLSRGHAGAGKLYLALLTGQRASIVPL